MTAQCRRQGSSLALTCSAGYLPSARCLHTEMETRYPPSCREEEQWRCRPCWSSWHCTQGPILNHAASPPGLKPKGLRGPLLGLSQQVVGGEVGLGVSLWGAGGGLAAEGWSARCCRVRQLGGEEEEEEMTQRLQAATFGGFVRAGRRRRKARRGGRVAQPQPPAAAIWGRAAGRREGRREGGKEGGEAGRPQPLAPFPRGCRRARRPRPLMQSEPASGGSSSPGGARGRIGRPWARSSSRGSAGQAAGSPHRRGAGAPAPAASMLKVSGAQIPSSILPGDAEQRRGFALADKENGSRPLCVYGFWCSGLLFRLGEGAFRPREVSCLRSRMCVILSLSMLFHCSQHTWKRNNERGGRRGEGKAYNFLWGFSYSLFVTWDT